MRCPEKMNARIAHAARRAPWLLALALLVAGGCGGGGGGSASVPGAVVTPPAAPAVAVTDPAQGEEVSDLDFLSASAPEPFEITISYSGGSAMDFTTLSVTFSMDGGAEQDITQYFSQVNESTIQSSGLIQFTNTLFTLPENDEPRRSMTVNVSIRSQSGITAAATGSFDVVPSGGDGGELPPAPPAS